MTGSTHMNGGGDGAVLAGLLDNDLYKFTMMHAVREVFPEVEVSYGFINRRAAEDRFTPAFLERLRAGVAALGELALSGEEAAYLEGLGLFPKAFVEHLRGFRLDPGQVEVSLSAEGELAMEVRGRWQDTILYEVPLMALVSEIYFETVGAAGWNRDLETAARAAREKGRRLAGAGCRFADFGTRRRRSLRVHERVVEALAEGGGECFLGTSNVHLARLAGCPPVGTMAHEWIMGHAGLGGVAGANRRALENWREVYGEKLLVALTDTYTSELFFREFAGELAGAYDGVRHDSACPLEFADRTVAFYRGEGIDPAEKRIVFSDGLDVDRAIEVQRHCGDRVGVIFGIGTHFTNDFPGSPALNMVIKLTAAGGAHVAKISDVPTKASGHPDAVAAALAAVEAANRG